MVTPRRPLREIQITVSAPVVAQESIQTGDDGAVIYPTIDVDVRPADVKDIRITVPSGELSRALFTGA